MKARLFIRGMKDPVELEREEAVAAQALISDSTKDPKTPFSIEGVWGGTKADMKFVVFPPNEEDLFDNGSVEPMSESEAGVFDVEIDPYRLEATVRGYLPAFWDFFYLRGKKSIRLEEYEGEPGKKSLTCIVLSPELYREHNARVERYKMFKAKKEFAEKKRLEGLEKLAEEEKKV